MKKKTVKKKSPNPAAATDDLALRLSASHADGIRRSLDAFSDALEREPHLSARARLRILANVKASLGWQA